MSYTVVLLTGKEQQNLSLEQVKDLFWKRQINQNSLIFSNENPNWLMLKRAFDLSQWIPTASPSAPSVNYTDSSQFPPNLFETGLQSAQTAVNQDFRPNDFNSNQTNSYTQNNQSQTFYQAETLPAVNKLQNIQSNYAPVNYSPNSVSSDAADRIGLRPAAIFLIVNALIYVLSSIIENSAVPENAGKVGTGVGKLIIPLAIDLYLASRLWKNESADSARKWVLVRTYLGFIVFGLIFPVIAFGNGNLIGAVFLLSANFLYFLSVALVLHGRQSPSPVRAMSGIGTFVIYVVLIIFYFALALVGTLAPHYTKLEFTNPQIEKHQIQGTEFQDKTTGAKVVLPEGWVLLSLSNPIITTPEARMIAMDKRGERLTMLEIVPVPAQLDMKRQSSAMILEQICDGVVKGMKVKAETESRFGANSVKEISRNDSFVGKHPAKLLILEKTDGVSQVKGHIIITYDELSFYVLHSWCPGAEYTESLKDMQFFQTNFTVPDKINSVFTQTAENEKSKK